MHNPKRIIKGRIIGSTKILKVPFRASPISIAGDGRSRFSRLLEG
jgi:hypothetical protein